MTLIIDVHALQSLPPSNINRDDTGAPKSAIFGGVPRQRVSSQSWKRAIRRDFETSLGREKVGYRTKRVADLITNEIVSLSADSDSPWDRERAAEATRQLFAATKIKLNTVTVKDDEDERGDEVGYLLFLSPRQITNAAKLLISLDGEKPSKKAASEALDSEHSVDIAMFGRMVADDPTFNVDAAVQVAHAIGIHESTPEFDYFTAVDDIAEDQEESGAGMIGTVQIMSSTLYRFASIDFESLVDNLGSRDAAVEATLAFISSFITSLPTGKQNTFAHNTLPELVYVTVRDSRSISLVNAFEQPVTTSDGVNRRLAGAQRLANEELSIERSYGFVPRAAFVVAMDELSEPFNEIATVTTLPELSEKVRSELAEASQS